MINCTLGSICIYTSGSSYYTNKHLLNSRSFVVSDGGSADLLRYGGLYGTSVTFQNAANQSLLLETSSALDLHHLHSSFPPFLLLPWLLLLSCFSGHLSSHQSCPEMVDSARDSLPAPTECSPECSCPLSGL